jgi:uncharacterized SAM-binding protein YcdF (DUF218 family)
MPRGNRFRIGRSQPKFHQQFFGVTLAALGLLLCVWLLTNTLTLRSIAAAPVDAYFVLGGSIKREIHVADLVKQHPNVPVLISSGSRDPCIKLIFERAQASMEQVWLEKCARSTFDNFYFATPILKRWNVHKVKLITSESHLPRALWMGQIMLGAHGIWVEPEIAIEEGIPANQESLPKTVFDLARASIWAVVGQFRSPQCQNLQSLVAVDMESWRRKGFHCEHQAGLDDEDN